MAGRSNIIIVIVVVVAIVIGWLFYLSSGKAVDPDVFSMAEVAQQVLAGKTLYVETWDNKGPLALLFYALPQLIVPHSYAAIQLAAFVLSLLMAGAFWKLLDDEPPLCRALAALLPLLLPLQSYEYAWASSEDVSNLFTTFVILLSYRALRRSRLVTAEMFISGAALALAFHARQTTVLFGVLPLLAIFSARSATAQQRVRAMLGFGLGGIVGWAMVLLLVLAVSDFSAYIDAVFIGPQRYQGHYWAAIQNLMQVRLNVIMFFLFAATLILLLRTQHKLFFAAMTIVTLGVVLSPLKPFEHYWEQTFPVLSLIVPLAMMSVTTTGGTDRNAIVITIIAFLAVNAVLTCGYLGLVNTHLHPNHRNLAQLDDVAQRIDALAADDDRLFAVGMMSGYFFFATDVEPASMYFANVFLHNMIDLLPDDPETVRNELRESPPTIIVIDDESLTRIEAGAPTRRLDARADRMLSDVLRSNRYEVRDQLHGWMILDRRQQ